MSMFKTGEAKIEAVLELCCKCGKNFVKAGEGAICPACLAKAETGGDRGEECKGAGKPE
jgi:predicted amidophosphoribosyltransferase